MMARSKAVAAPARMGADDPSGPSARGSAPPAWSTSRGLQLTAATLLTLALTGLPHPGQADDTGAAQGAAPAPSVTSADKPTPRELAEQLELGPRQCAETCLLGPPRPEWVSAAGDGGAAATAWLWPVEEGRLLRGLGVFKFLRPHPPKPSTRKHPKPARHKHLGLDIGAPEGTPIHAAQSGLVVYSGHGLRGYGNLIAIVHADGSVAFYAHCKVSRVKPGTLVSRGDVIGEVGQTGYARGPHLHFEYRVHGEPQDPTPLFGPVDKGS